MAIASLAGLKMSYVAPALISYFLSCSYLHWLMAGSGMSNNSSVRLITGSHSFIYVIFSSKHCSCYAQGKTNNKSKVHTHLIMNYASVITIGVIIRLSVHNVAQSDPGVDIKSVTTLCGGQGCTNGSWCTQDPHGKDTHSMSNLQ